MSFVLWRLREKDKRPRKERKKRRKENIQWQDHCLPPGHLRWQRLRKEEGRFVIHIHFSLLFLALFISPPTLSYTHCAICASLRSCKSPPLHHYNRPAHTHTPPKKSANSSAGSPQFMFVCCGLLVSDRAATKMLHLT